MIAHTFIGSASKVSGSLMTGTCAKTENYYVLRNTQIPAVLVEMGFLSNYSESQKLLSAHHLHNSCNEG